MGNPTKMNYDWGTPMTMETPTCFAGPTRSMQVTQFLAPITAISMALAVPSMALQ